MFYSSHYLSAEKAREIIQGTTADTGVVAMIASASKLSDNAELIIENIHKVLTPISTVIWGQYNGLATINRAIKWMELHELAEFNGNRLTLLKSGELAEFNGNRLTLLKSSSEIAEMLRAGEYGARFHAESVDQFVSAALLVKQTHKGASSSDYLR